MTSRACMHAHALLIDHLPRMHACPCTRAHRYVIVLLGAWRALAVGTLHAYHSVRVELVMTTGLSLQASGELMAMSDAMALLLFLPLSLLPRYFGLRPLLVVAPLVGLASSLALLPSIADYTGVPDDDAPHHASAPPRDGPTWVQRGALLALSSVEVASPIIPLALVPAAAGSDELGAAYGTIEVLFACFQMALTLMLGAVRKLGGGFGGALCLTAAGFAAAVAVALPLIARTARG